MMSRYARMGLVFTLIAAIHLAIGMQAHAQSSQTAKTIFLHAEGIPYVHRVDNDLQYLMMRELCRQGFVLACELDFGLRVRDQILGELKPTDEPVVDLALLERANSSGEWHLKLFAPEAGVTPEAVSNLWPTEAKWESTFSYETSLESIYDFASIVFDLASFDEFRSAVDAIGIGIDAPRSAAKEGAAPPVGNAARWEEILGSVDYVRQYGLARELHQAIEQHGESAYLLSLLSRTYANLSLLTDHHANASSRAFAARALVLLARLNRKFELNEDQRFNEVYVWALVGHQLKAEQLAQKLQTPLHERIDDAWAHIIKSYISDDARALKTAIEAESDTRDWTIRLWMELVKGYRYKEWLVDSLQLLETDVPTAYGTYAFLAILGEMRGVRLRAGYGGPIALAAGLPQSLSSLNSMPDAVLGVAQPAPEELFGLANDTSFPLSPSRVVSALRQVSEADQIASLSWSGLAYLLEEELFVMGCNYIAVAQDAVEYSLDAEVDSVINAIPEHRYAAFVESQRYSASKDKDVDKSMELTSELVLKDIRGSMLSMWSTVRYATWKLNPAAYEKTNNHWYRPCVDFTLPGLINNTALGGWDPGSSDPEYWIDQYAKMFHTVVPKSELNVRFAIQSAKKSASIRELVAFEKRLSSDAIAYEEIARGYVRIYAETELKSLLHEAVRCYSKSLEFSRNPTVVRELSRAYFMLEDFEKFETCLKDFLASDYEDNGLERPRVSHDLAMGLMQIGRWREAQPHALRAAQTYSAWGLIAASAAAEGLEEWDASEKWIRSASENYPSSIGANWYFWCRRTGRGDLAAARSLAKQYFLATETNLTSGALFRTGTFQLLEGDLQAAFKAFEQCFATDKTPPVLLLVAQTVREQEGEKSAQELISKLLPSIPADKQDPNGSSLVEFFQDSDAKLESALEIADSLRELSNKERAFFYTYLLAKELTYKGMTKEATELYQEILPTFVHTEFSATLAGAELAKQLGR